MKVNLEKRAEYNRKCLKWIEATFPLYADAIAELNKTLENANDANLRMEQWLDLQKRMHPDTVGELVEILDGESGRSETELFNEEPWITYCRWTGEKPEAKAKTTAKRTSVPAQSSVGQTVEINELLGANESYYTVADIFNRLPNDITYRGKRGYLMIASFGLEWSSLNGNNTLNLVWSSTAVDGMHDIFDCFIDALKFIGSREDDVEINWP